MRYSRLWLFLPCAHCIYQYTPSNLRALSRFKIPYQLNQFTPIIPNRKASVDVSLFEYTRKADPGCHAPDAEVVCLYLSTCIGVRDLKRPYHVHCSCVPRGWQGYPLGEVPNAGFGTLPMHLYMQVASDIKAILHVR